jgi:DNA repair exonuclease SbcCD ATPase subunit
LTVDRTLLEELARADSAHSAALEELDTFLRETVSVGTRSDELARALAAAPDEWERLAQSLSSAEANVGEFRAALALAEAELAAAEERRSTERLAAARRAHERAKDELTLAERRVTACQAAQTDHEREVDELRREVGEVEARAAALATALRGRPRLAPEAGNVPAPGLAGVAEWAAAARAALLVARSGITAEQEAVIRQANELASSLLGEAQAAASVAAVARRLERAGGS